MLRRLIGKFRRVNYQDPRIKEFIEYYKSTDDLEILKMIEFMKKYNQFNMMNCELSKKYEVGGVIIEQDDACPNSYIKHEGKKLYFPQDMSREKIANLYIALSKEQDENSPHRYLSQQDLEYISNYKKSGGYIRIFEFGSMEGMFSLKLSDLSDEIHLFECNPDWIEALNNTFSPWKDKVKILNNYVSDQNDGQNISLDKYLLGQPFRGLDIVKMDIEGAEISALRGMTNFMKEALNFKLYVCSYHKQGDEENIRRICNEYRIEHNPGYFCFFKDPEYGPPFVRRCLLKISK